MSIKNTKATNWVMGASIVGFLTWFIMPTYLAPQDLIAFARNPENGLLNEVNTGKYKITLLHKTLDYSLAQEYSIGVIQRDKLAKRREDLAGLQYYNMQIGVADNPSLNITSIGVTDFDALQKRLQYLNFGFKNDICLVEQGDTLRPVLFHFEDTYDLSPSRNFVLAFDKKKANEYADKTFIIDSPALGTGIVKSFFDGTLIKSSPKLKI